MGIFSKLKEMLGVAPEKIIDPIIFNDPVALRTEWKPLVMGGSNVRTHEAIQVYGNRIEFKNTFIMKAIPIILLVIAFIILYFGKLSEMIHTRNFSLDQFTAQAMIEERGLIWAAPVIIFLFIALLSLIHTRKAIIFDKTFGYYWKGSRGSGPGFNPANQKQSVKLDEIHALQIIAEFVRNNSSSTRHRYGSISSSYYTSYELNIVKSDGQRLNIVDHGNKEGLIHDAKMLAQFLNVPLWDSTESS